MLAYDPFLGKIIERNYKENIEEPCNTLAEALGITGFEKPMTIQRRP